MAVTPKTAGAVATVLGGGAAAGVGIHQLSKETPINSDLLKKLETVKTKFGLDLENADCKNLLRKDKYSKDDYRSAILGCSQSKTFSAIAKNLGLEVLSSEDKESSKWNTWWTANKSKIESLVATTKGKTTWDGDSGAQSLLVNHCTNPTNNKTFSKETNNKEWYDFLTACTKEKTETTSQTPREIFNKDFWTSKPTIESKIKEAGFALKTNIETTCKTKLEEEFDEYKDNYKEAVVVCVTSNNFENRAKELGLHALPSEDTENSWNTDWSNIKERIKKAISSLTTATPDSWSDLKDKVKAHCTANNKTITKTTKDEEWKNYLNACTKDKTTTETGKEKQNVLLTKDFWSGKPTNTQS